MMQLRFLLIGLFLFPASLWAIEETTDKRYGEIRDDSALVYFVRLGERPFKAFKDKIYFDDRLLGVLHGDSYTFQHVPPGKYLYWNLHGQVPYTVRLEGGMEYFFYVHAANLAAVDPVIGREELGSIKVYSTLTTKDKKHHKKMMKLHKKMMQDHHRIGNPEVVFNAAYKYYRKHNAGWAHGPIAVNPTVCDVRTLSFGRIEMQTTERLRNTASLVSRLLKNSHFL